MILDGWGKSPDPKVSAIDNANVPFINSLYKNYPNAQLRTDGLNVGLPDGQMGNSEVGHMNLGAGRIVYQDLAKINLAVANNTLAKEKVLIDAFIYAKEHNKKVHLLGLVSDGGVHSHTSHLRGLIDASQEYGLEKVYIHAFTDGRDTPPRAAPAAAAVRRKERRGRLRLEETAEERGAGMEMKGAVGDELTAVTVRAGAAPEGRPGWPTEPAEHAAKSSDRGLWGVRPTPAPNMPPGGYSLSRPRKGARGAKAGSNHGSTRIHTHEQRARDG